MADRRTIRYFARESNLPLTLGMMVDTSGSQRKVLDAERGACLRFLDQVVRPNKDQVFIMQFDSSVQVRQALTSSVAKLDDALAYVDTETKAQVRRQQGGGTLLYDAVVRASDDIMKKLTRPQGADRTLRRSRLRELRAVWTMHSKRRNDPTR